MASVTGTGDKGFDKTFFQVYIVCFPFLSALSPAVWMPLPTLVALMAGCYYMATGRIWRSYYFESDDLLLAFMFFAGVVAIVMNVQYAGSKNLNFTLWFAATFIVSLIWVRAWLRIAQITPAQIGAAATIALMILSIAIIVEFILINTTGHYLSDYIPYSTASADMPQANVLLVLLRPRGLAVEPTCTAIVFEALAPIAWIYLRDKRKLLYGCGAITFIGFTLIFSAAGWVCFFLVAMFLLFMYGKIGRISLIFSIIAALVFVLILTVPDVQWVFQQIIGRKILDLLGMGDTVVDAKAGRALIYKSALVIFRDYPFGIGWGMISQMFDSGVHIPGIPQPVSRGMVSLYAEILVSAGIPGLLIFIAYLGQKISRIMKRHDADTTAVLFALLAVSLHHAIVLEFWYPMLWFLIALADYMLDFKSVVIVPEPEPDMAVASVEQWR